LLACVGDSSTPPNGNDAATTDAGPTDGGSVDVAADAPAAGFTIGGAVHFLQASGGDGGTGLVLANGTDTVTVTQAGAFAFPKKATSYDVTVQTNPPGQVCSVRSGGKGTATADVTNVVVGCTIALQSAGGTAQFTINSKSAVPIQGVAPLAFSNDVPAKLLVSLTIPSVALNNGSFDNLVSEIDLDGKQVVVGEYGNQNNVGQAAHTIYTIVDAPAGPHTVAAAARTAFGFGNNVATFFAPFPVLLDAIVLDSLSTFVSVASGTGTANTTTSSSTPASIMADVAYSVVTAAPVLALFQAPKISVGNSSPSLFTAAFSLLVDGLGQGSARVAASSQDCAPLIPALTTSAAGAHALRTQWASLPNATSITSKIAPRMDAIVFAPAAKATTSVLAGDKSTTQATFTSIPGLNPLAVTPTTATQALVVFHADSAGGGADKYAGGEFTLAVDNAASKTGLGAIASYPGAAVPITSIQLVPLTAGAHTLQAQFRATNLDLHTGPGTTSLTAIVIE
jgi:hypothetical protein